MPVLRANEFRPDVSRTLLQLTLIDERLTRLQDVELPRVVDVDEFLSSWSEGTALWNVVQSDLVDDPEILSFLELAGLSGAPLASLNDKVRSYLESIDAQDEFVIRSRE